MKIITVRWPDLATLFIFREMLVGTSSLRPKGVINFGEVFTISVENYLHIHLEK